MDDDINALSLVLGTVRMQPSKYEQIPVKYSATFSGSPYVAPGIVVELGLTGCRAFVDHLLGPYDSFGLLIDVPGEAPLSVELAEVRWLNGHEVGIKFINIAVEDRQRLSKILSCS